MKLHMGFRLTKSSSMTFSHTYFLFICSMLRWFTAFSQTLGNFKPLLSLPLNTPSASEIFNTTYMIQMVKSFTLCGTWQRFPLFKNDASALTQQEGMIIANTSGISSLNLMFVDSHYLDQNFIMFPLNFTTPLSFFDGNKTLEIKDQILSYYKGTNFLSNDIKEMIKCRIEKLSVNIYNTGEIIAKSLYHYPFEHLNMDVEIYAPDCALNVKSSMLTSYNQEKAGQRWFYVFLNIFRLIDNIYISTLQHYKDNDDQTFKVQLFFVLCIESYLFFFNLKFAQFLKSAFIISVPITFLSLGLGCTFFLQNIKKWAILCTIISSMIAANFVFSCSTEMHWLMLPFAVIPLIDLFDCFRSTIKRRYGSLIYVGYLLPIWLMIAYLKLYPDNPTRLTPEPKLVLNSGLCLVLGFLVNKAKRVFQRSRALRDKMKYFVNSEQFAKEEICSICIEKLNAGVSGVQDDVELACEQNLNTDCHENKAAIFSERQNDQIIKTPCNHTFHLKCLSSWFKTKEICPYCRKELVEIAEILELK